MVPFPVRNLFRSRWAAIGWAIAVCFSAVEFASDQGQDRGSVNDAAAVQSALD